MAQFRQILTTIKTYSLITILTVLSLCFSPIIFIFIFLPIYAWRYIVSCLQTVFRPDLVGLVPPRSTALAQDKLLEPNPKCNLVVMVAIEGQITLEEFYEQADSKIAHNYVGGDDNKMKYPEFSQYYEKWMGFIFWKWETEFKSEDHFSYYNPNDPNQPVTPADLPRIEMELIQEPFLPGFSPWKILIIPNYQGHDQKQQTLICYKIHHGLGDGFSIFNLLVKEVCEMTDNHYAKPNLITKSIGRQVMDCALLIIKSPFEFIEQLIVHYDDNEWRVAEKDMSSVWFSSQTVIPVELGYIKGIKNDHGVCFTAVIVGAITGGIRSYLLKRGKPVPSIMSSLTPFPMSGDFSHAKLRNYYSYAFLTFPTGLETPHQRVTFIDKNINSLKKSSTILTNFWELPIVARLVPCMIKPLLYNRFSTCLLSNFPGPNDPCKFLGKNVTYMGFNAGLLIGNTGLGFMMMSYNGKFTLRVNGCESLFSTQADLDDLLNLILEELQNLKNDAKTEKDV